MARRGRPLGNILRDIDSGPAVPKRVSKPSKPRATSSRPLANILRDIDRTPGFAPRKPGHTFSTPLTLTTLKGTPGRDWAASRHLKDSTRPQTREAPTARRYQQGPLTTNTAEGNPREGQQFRLFTRADKPNVKYHEYNIDGKRKVIAVRTGKKR